MCSKGVFFYGQFGPSLLRGELNVNKFKVYLTSDYDEILLEVTFVLTINESYSKGKICIFFLQILTVSFWGWTISADYTRMEEG